MAPGEKERERERERGAKKEAIGERVGFVGGRQDRETGRTERESPAEEGREDRDWERERPDGLVLIPYPGGEGGGWAPPGDRRDGGPAAANLPAVWYG